MDQAAKLVGANRSQFVLAYACQSGEPVPERFLIDLMSPSEGQAV